MFLGIFLIAIRWWTESRTIYKSFILRIFMDLLIMDRWDAEYYNPSRETHAIRIHGPGDVEPSLSPLRDSPLYRTYAYYFDDSTPDNLAGGSLLFDRDIARKIIEDFSGNKDYCKDLLVHCMMGISRSPAVAIALNKIFNLGHDSDYIKLRFPYFNPWVYDVMIRTSEEMK